MQLQTDEEVLGLLTKKYEQRTLSTPVSIGDAAGSLKRLLGVLVKRDISTLDKFIEEPVIKEINAMFYAYRTAIRSSTRLVSINSSLESTITDAYDEKMIYLVFTLNGLTRVIFDDDDLTLDTDYDSVLDIIRTFCIYILLTLSTNLRTQYINKETKEDLFLQVDEETGTLKLCVEGNGPTVTPIDENGLDETSINEVESKIHHLECRFDKQQERLNSILL